MVKSRALPSSIAAIDLGSNSFHTIVARVVSGEVRVVDRLRERVALGEGLTAEKKLSAPVRDRALASLRRIAQRLRDMRPGTVRAVGTNTLRQLKDGGAFVAAAERALGRPIEIVSGREEARLIYLGVAHHAPDTFGRRLVVDIGGGSTECIVGERFEPIEVASLYMGCIAFTRRYFGGGRITETGFEQAIIGALVELRTIQRRYRGIGWSSSIGSSGTIQAIADILRENGWSESGAITPKGLKRLRKAALDAGSIDALTRIRGLPEDRAPVFPGGLAILIAVFESLALAEMLPSSGALREGVLYDLLGRIQHEDVRDRTIRAFTERFHVDVEQALRVERTVLELLGQAEGALGIERETASRPLSWAARLHEIGMFVAYSGHHKHGSYILANADMPGFSREDQELLAALVRLHRGKLGKGLLAEVAEDHAPLVRQLVPLLRVAAGLHRSRSSRPLPAVRVRALGRNGFRIAFPKGWLDDHPLTRATLESEAQLLEALGFELAFD